MGEPKMWIPIVVVVALFIVGIVVWSRLGLHRTMATMPPIPGETVLNDASGLTVVIQTTGNPGRTPYLGALVRVTNKRVLVSQTGIGSGDLLRAVLLWGDSEAAMRAADAEAFARAGSFVIVRARPTDATRSPEGAWIVPVDPIWPSSTTLNGPVKWEFPAPVAEWVQKAMTAP